MQVTTAYSLTVEQVSQFRGTLMSLQSTASNLGVAIGAGIGGIIILFFGYAGIGIIASILCILAALIFYWFTIDLSD